MKNEKKILDYTKKSLKNLVKYLEVEADFSVELSNYKDSDNKKVEYVDVKFEGEDLGILVGYLGRNLSAVQRILGIMVNKKAKEMDEESEYVRVVMDVSGYREGRTSHLEKYANQIREEVLSSGQEMDLPRMSAYERRVIHLTLSEFDDVVTESFGEGRERHVRVMPAGK